MKTRTTLYVDIEIPEGVEIPKDMRLAFCEQVTEDIIEAVKSYVYAKKEITIKGKTRLIDKEV